MNIQEVIGVMILFVVDLNSSNNHNLVRNSVSENKIIRYVFKILAFSLKANTILLFEVCIV